MAKIFSIRQRIGFSRAFHSVFAAFVVGDGRGSPGKNRPCPPRRGRWPGDLDRTDDAAVAVVRFGGALMLERTHERAVGRRYLSSASLAHPGDTETRQLAAATACPTLGPHRGPARSCTTPRSTIGVRAGAATVVTMGVGA